MDKRIRKYILYKAKTLEERKRELQHLQIKRRELRNTLLDSTGGMAMDGMPHAKGKVGNPTEQKALKLVEIDRRINKLIEEIEVFDRFEKSLTDKVQIDVYRETVKKNCTDLTAKAQLLHMGRRQLIESRAKMLRYIAMELGEYFEERE
jgi:hypothetical protein